MKWSALSIFLLFLCNSKPAASGGWNYLAGSRQAGLSYSGITLTSHWATFYNQAVLAEVDQLSFGFYAERKFGLQSLNAGALSLALPIKNTGTLGVSFYQFSHDQYYNQQKYGVTLARKFGDKVSAGLQFDAFNVHIQEYGSTWKIVAEAGLLFKLNDKIKTGIHVFNPAGSNWASDEEEQHFPTANIGSSYRFSEKVTWHLALEKSVQQDLRIKSGLTYNPLPVLQLQTGLTTEPLIYSVGVRYQWKWLAINLSFGFHQQLGTTPYLETNYEGNE